MSATAPTLADIIAALQSGTPLAKPARAKPPAPTPAPKLSVGKAYALKRTGYVRWKALARIIEIQPQVCTCCGNTVEAVRGEFYKLANGTAHAVWLRPEGYEIEAQEDLPFEFVWLEPRTVSACASCLSSPAALAIEHCFTIAGARLQLEFPF